MQSLVIAAINTGMRRGELFNLKWFDVDFARGVIHVRQTKTDKDRVVPMNETVRGLLESRPRTSGYVFPSPKTGGRLIEIKHKFDEARTAAKIKDFRFHDLRHTAATRLADAGVNVIVIAEVLGHGDIRTTKRYSHVMEESKREAVEMLADSGKARQIHAKKTKRQAAGPAVSLKKR